MRVGGLLRRFSTAVAQETERAVLTKLTYPRRPPAGFQGGRIVTPTHWKKIGGIFPAEAWDGDVNKLHDEEETVDVSVTDARTLQMPPTLARHGFELRQTPMPPVDLLHSDEAVREKYYAPTARLVEEATGATEAIVFQHMRRDSLCHNKESDGARNEATASAHGAVQRVHADYTVDNAPKKLRELEEAGLVPAGLVGGRRWAIVNVWRSLDAEGPITEKPLAVLDASTVAADETFTYALVHEDQPPLVGYNNSVAVSPAHEWFYFSGMRADEALLFFTFDGSTSPARFVFHSAIDLDGAGAARPRPRRSIECRCLAVW